MARIREKISTFFFGLTVGLLIGCAIFIFKLDDYVKNFRISDVNKPEFEETTKLNEEDQKNKKELKKKQVANLQNRKNESEGVNDSLAIEKQAASNDSSIADYESENGIDDNISVLKEELVGTKNVKVKEEGSTAAQKKDSVAAEIAGVNEPANNEFMTIEFWKTPLNSKGYKMSRNKILLYGLNEQNVDVVKIDENYFLKNNNQVFRLSYSNEFHKMERVNESSILARIN